MKMPMVLDASMAEARQLAPFSLHVTEKETPLSTAEMQIHLDQAVTVGELVRVYRPNGNAVYAVTAEDTDYMQDTQDVTMQHAAIMLDYDLLVGEHTPKMISGKDTATVRQTITYILARQGTVMWQLGRCDFEDEGAWTIKDTGLLAAIEEVTLDLVGCVIEFDQSNFPWTINLRKLDAEEDPECEMRLTRNVSSMRVTVDKSNTYTRLYAFGKNNLPLPGAGYVEKNTGRWGVINAVWRDESIEDANLLLSGAQTMLDEHCNPTISATVTAEDMCSATGEPMDRLTISRRCRVPLPKHGISMVERIVQIEWEDLITAPTTAKVTLATQGETLSSFVSVTNSMLAQITRGSGSGGRLNSKEAKRAIAAFTEAAGPGGSQVVLTVDRIKAAEADIQRILSGEASIRNINAQSITLAGRALFLGPITIDGQTYNVVRYGIGD